MAQLHMLVGADESQEAPSIRRIGLSDLKDALIKGWQDFSAMPSHAIFLCIIYPLIGIMLAYVTFGYSILPLLYPLAAGFALVGPLAAICLYELSRRREAGLGVESADALDVLRSPSIGAIVALGALLMFLFLVWIAVAKAIYESTMGYDMPTSIIQFMHDVLTTPAGWNLIIFGNGIGFLFAVVALTISVVSFPLLIDRDVGAAVAIATSFRAVAANPVMMAIWGLIVAVVLFIGSLPFFLGLTVALPVLGHATWHLYRRVVDSDRSPRHEFHPRQKVRRYAADFPTALFPFGGEK